MPGTNARPSLLAHVLSAGFPLDPACIIHLFIGGSQLHGAKVEGYDDLDIYGCYIEPPERILGVMPLEHYVWSSGSDREKNTANDVNVTMYSLHRWGELMLKGNPAIVHFLYANGESHGGDTWATHILPHRKSLLSKKAAEQYLGFADSQRMRLTGERGMGRHGQRPDLIEQYGFDTKFSMHYIRLLYECRELLKSLYLMLPRPQPERQHLIDIRSGKFTQDEVFAHGRELAAECESLLAASTLPHEIDRTHISRLIASAYRAHWQQFEATRPGP
ncbi:MAG: DNA polymerase beta superfamily protein [Terriglobales bacterium]